MIAKRFARVTAPHDASLADAIRPLMTIVPNQAFHLRFDNDAVIIEQADWTGVDLAAVQAAVDAAPPDSLRLRAQQQITDLPIWQKAAWLVVLDEVNRLRQNPATVFPAVTAAQFWQAIKAKIEVLL